MTFQSFPLYATNPLPSYFATQNYITPISRNADGSLARQGIWHEGDEVHIRLTQAGADTYEIRSWWSDDVIATGAVSGVDVNLGSSLDPGWYRVYFSGASTSAVYGDSYGATNVTIIKRSSHLPDNPASTFNIFNWKPNGYGRTDAMVDAASGAGSPTDIIQRAVMGMGVGRCEYTLDLSYDIHSTAVAGAKNVDDAILFANNVLRKWWLSPGPGDPGVADPVRPRHAWLAFAVQTADSASIPNNGSQPSYIGWGSAYAKTTAIDRENLYVALAAGTTASTYKLTVRYPNSSTIVETYDNLVSGADAQTKINTTTPSAYIEFWNGTASLPALTSPVAIGTQKRDRIAQIVAALYPLGYTHYEGPWNEPSAPDYGSIATQCKFVQDAVHRGHPDAKFGGWCALDITNETHWRQFLANGGGNYVDVWMNHDYNTCLQGDFVQGRQNIERWLGWLTEYGVGPKEIWQTEATHAKVQDLFAIAKWRYAKHPIIKTLLWEQYGCTMEHNPYWYDNSHGFWGYSSYWQDTSGSVLPQAALYRTLTDETFGKNFHHRVDFRSVTANTIFLGNVYGDGTAASTMVLIAGSCIDGTTVKVAITGTASDITIVDAFGNESTVAQSSGRITVPVLDVPTYIRLPTGVNGYIYSVAPGGDDWGTSPSPSVSATRIDSTLGGAAAPGLADDLYMGTYAGGTLSSGITHSTVGLPDAAIIKFVADKVVKGIVIRNGPVWQSMPGMWDYDVQTLNADGVTWDAAETVTRTAPSSLLWGDGITQRETFFPFQWIETVMFAPPVTTKGIRVYVRGATYGGAPDASMATFGGFQMDANQMAIPKLAIQEISVLSATTITPPASYVTTVTADSPIGYWPVDELTGTTAASLFNTPTIDGTYITTSTRGRPPLISGGGYSVGSTNLAGGITVVHNSALNCADITTVEAWINLTAYSPQGNQIFNKGNGPITVNLNVDKTVVVQRFVTAQSGVTLATSNVPIGLNTPTHLVVTKNGSTTKIYINGVDVTVVGTNATATNNTTTLTLGFGGLLDFDAFALYSTALSGARVLAHYVAGIAPTLPVNAVVPRIAA